MICDPITRQQVEIIGRYPPQGHAYRWGRRVVGEFRFVRVRYGDYFVEWARQRGGYPLGHEKDVDVNDLRADQGVLEISVAYEEAPLLVEAVKAGGAP